MTSISIIPARSGQADLTRHHRAAGRRHSAGATGDLDSFVAQIDLPHFVGEAACGRAPATPSTTRWSSATAGLAVDGVEVKAAATAPAATLSETSTRAGPAAGAGLEYAVTDKFSLKAEVLYVDPRTQKDSFGPDAIDSVATSLHGRIGLNQRSDRGEAPNRNRRPNPTAARRARDRTTHQDTGVGRPIAGVVFLGGRSPRPSRAGSTRPGRGASASRPSRETPRSPPAIATDRLTLGKSSYSRTARSSGCFKSSCNSSDVNSLFGIDAYRRGRASMHGERERDQIGNRGDEIGRDPEADRDDPRPRTGQ